MGFTRKIAKDGKKPKRIRKTKKKHQRELVSRKRRNVSKSHESEGKHEKILYRNRRQSCKRRIRGWTKNDPEEKRNKRGQYVYEIEISSQTREYVVTDLLFMSGADGRTCYTWKKLQ